MRLATQLLNVSTRCLAALPCAALRVAAKQHSLRHALAALVVLFPITPALADSFTTIDGKTHQATIQAIAADGTVAAGDKQVDLQGLRRIEHADVTADELPLRVIRLYLADGSQIIAEKLKIADETVTFDLAEAKARTLPLTSLRGVVFKPMSVDEYTGKLKADPSFAAAMADDLARIDTLHVTQDDQIITVRGTLGALGADDATFIYNDQERKVALSKVYGLTIAAPATPPDVTGMTRVHLQGGSKLWGKPVLKDGKLTLTRPDGMALDVPWDRVIQLDVRSARMAFLSDLKPTDVTVEPLLLDPFDPVMDASIVARPLRIGDRSYERGIGVMTTTRMTWRIDGDYDVLAAEIGIDESVGDQGDCIVKVVGDGRELFSRRITGADKPLPIRVDVTGVDRLELIADAGAGLDLSDRVNFADARLIKDQ